MADNNTGKKNKAGRKPVYSYEYLLRELESYVAQNKGVEITIAGLANNTSVDKKYIWRDNKSIREVIDKINGQQMGMLTNIEAYEITPGPFNGFTFIVDQYFNNKKMLMKKALEQDELVNSYRKDALEGYKFKKENAYLKDKNSKIERELETNLVEVMRLKKKIEYYENEIKKMAVEPTHPSVKGSKRLEKDILKLEESDLEIASIKQLFNELKTKYKK